MGPFIPKLYNDPCGIEYIGMGKYMTGALKHFDAALNTRAMFVKFPKYLLSPVIFFSSRFIGQLTAGKPEDLSILYPVKYEKEIDLGDLSVPKKRLSKRY